MRHPPIFLRPLHASTSRVGGRTCTAGTKDARPRLGTRSSRTSLSFDARRISRRTKRDTDTTATRSFTSTWARLVPSWVTALGSCESSPLFRRRLAQAAQLTVPGTSSSTVSELTAARIPMPRTSPRVAHTRPSLPRRATANTSLGPSSSTSTPPRSMRSAPAPTASSSTPSF